MGAELKAKVIAPSFLSDEFLSKYKDAPEHMTPLGAFTYYRTYSRFLPELKRRETWKETCARTVQYSFSIEYIHRIKMSLKIDLVAIRKEAEEFFDNMFNLRQFTSGRTMWTGGSEVADEYPMSNFNCSFTNIEKWEDLSELFYLLMLGSGVGFKSTPEMAKGMAPIRTNVNLILSEYKPVKVEERLENTEVVVMENGYAKIYVGDSKEGWRDSLTEYINLLTKEENEHVHTIKVSFNSVRPQGERLKKFGGTASGPQPLHDMFQGIDNTLKNKIDDTLAPIEVNDKGYGHVRPIHILDMCNLIANNVVAGGVRRSSEIMVFDPKDYEVMLSKYAMYGLWGDNQFETHEEIRQDLIRLGIPVPGWFDRLAVKNYDKEKYGDLPFNTYRTEAIKHRAQSNNSMQFMERPYKGLINLIFKLIRFGGEPGFVNMAEMLRRRDNAQGTNPCGEIILDSKQQCNLTTLNLAAFSDGENFDLEAAKRAQALSARAGLRMTLLDLELPEWDRIHKRDRLIGCSMAGFQDAVGIYDNKTKAHILSEMHKAANEAAEEYADALRIPKPLLTTASKPDGCWTSEYTRVTDSGILFMDEIEEAYDDEFGFQDVTKELTVHGNRVTKVYKNDVKDILNVRLKNNRVLRISPQHPMSVKDKWVKAQDLKIGDILDYELGNYRNENEVRLLPLEDELESRRSDVADYKLPEYMSPDLAYLLGAYYANGCFTTNYRLKYHCGHYEPHQKVQRLWKELFNVDTNIVRSKDRDSYTQDFRSTKIRLWMDKNNIRKYDDNGEMIVPLVVRSSSYKSVLSFIAGYADNDGCFYNKTFCIDSVKGPFLRHLQEVAEAAGLSFGLSTNPGRKNGHSNNLMHKLTLSRAFSNPDAIEYINSISVKAKMKGNVEPGQIASLNPYTVVGIEVEENQQTYDIEVENQHWYYQGALKSHNTLALVAGGVSPGVHHSHAPYYIRRIRVSISDALAEVALIHGWSVNYEDSGLVVPKEKATKAVIDFPIKTTARRTKSDVGALEQLEDYFLYQKEYTEHNTSNTIHVRDHEWGPLEDEIYKRWDDFVGVTFLSLYDNAHPLMPYEEITKEQYEEMASKFMPFDPKILEFFETTGVSDLDDNDPDCATGGCPTR